MNVLFVCTGNTCRSSMAEGIFKALVNSEKLEGYGAASRGTHALDGDPASENSVKALKSLWNIDISGHRAAMVSESDVKNADLILTMTGRHRDMLRRSFPSKQGDIFTLKEYVQKEYIQSGTGFSSGEQDITDPYGMPYENYEKCAQEIYDCISLLIDKLR